MAQTGCRSFTTDTPLPPRLSSQMFCTPSRSMPSWPQSEWGWGSAGLRLPPMTEGPLQCCPHSLFFLFVLLGLPSCRLLEPSFRSPPASCLLCAPFMEQTKAQPVRPTCFLPGAGEERSSSLASCPLDTDPCFLTPFLSSCLDWVLTAQNCKVSVTALVPYPAGTRSSCPSRTTAALPSRETWHSTSRRCLGTPSLPSPWTSLQTGSPHPTSSRGRSSSR